MKYSSGETPQVGDKVLCINSENSNGVLLTTREYIVTELFESYGCVQLDRAYTRDGWCSERLKLVSRAELSLDQLQSVENKPVKLHLGCFNKKIYNFVNVDIRSEVNPDITDDCMKLTKFENDSVDLIYTSHMMEHANRAEGLGGFKRYYEVLKSGGELYVSVPDLEMVFRYYILHQDLRLLQNFLYGSQKHSADYHLNGWDFKTLKEDLESIGFKNVERYDTWKTEWSHIDDYSKAYLPHMDFTNGVLMSLNVKATK